MSEAVLSVRVIAPEVPGLEPLGQWSEFTQMAHIAGVDCEVLGGAQATFPAVCEFMRGRADVLIWSGHGRENRLVTADGQGFDGEDLATYAKPSLARVVVLAACLSAHPDDDLDSLTMALSQAGMNAIGMNVSVRDMAAITFNVEFVRAMAAGADLARSFRVAQKRMAGVSKECAQSAFLIPALTNGYRMIADHVSQLDTRVANVEVKLDQVLAKLDRRR